MLRRVMRWVLAVVASILAYVAATIVLNIALRVAGALRVDWFMLLVPLAGIIGTAAGAAVAPGDQRKLAAWIFAVMSTVVPFVLFGFLAAARRGLSGLPPLSSTDLMGLRDTAVACGITAILLHRGAVMRERRRAELESEA